jgi:hypothetical protein
MCPLLPLHAAATFALTGLIWTIQLVHYPLFSLVGPDSFPSYHQQHTTRITWLVAPLMLTELLTAASLVYLGNRNPWLLASLVPLIFNWLSTWRVQIPLHNILTSGFNLHAHQRLVSSNWWRTAAWSSRTACLLLIIPS